MRKIFFTFLLFPVFCLAQNKNTIRAKVEKAFEIVGNNVNDWEEFPSPIHEISISERTISLIWKFPSYSGSLDLHSSIAPECKTTDEGIMMIYSECKRIGKINDDIYYSALVTIEKNNQVVVMIFQSNSNTGTAYSGTAIKN